MLGEIIDIVNSKVEKWFLEKKEYEQNYLKLSQSIDFHMSAYHEKINNLKNHGGFDDFFLSIDNAIDLLKEGLDLLEVSLKEIKYSEVFIHLNNNDRKEITNFIEYTKEIKEKIEDEDYYDEVYEVRLDVMHIFGFSEKWHNSLNKKKHLIKK